MTAPKLRFKDFTSEWERNKLADLVSFSKGKNISKNDIHPDGMYECIRYGELYTDYNEVVQVIKSKTNLNKSLLVFSHKNDIIIPSSGETREDIATASCVMMDGVALGGDLNILRGKENGVFLSYYLNSQKKREISQMAQGNSVVHLYSKELANLEILKPTLQEQQKIADFLTSVDEKINLLKKKKELLEQYKKGVMQKIFSQELRFKDDEGNDFPEWEHFRLKDVANFRRGSFPQPYGLPQWLDEKNGEPFVQVYDVAENMKLKKKTKIRISKLAQVQSVFVKKGSLILTIQGSIGRIALTQYDSYVDRTLLIFQSFKQPIIIDFFKYAIFLLFEMEKRKAPGGTIKTITKEVLSDFIVNLPCLEEQQKIADFLSALDDKIDLVEQQINKTELWKKGLLQQMFM